MKTVAIHQPNYLPWLGYFHKMNQADVFVLLDNVQFSKGSYGNRVKIKTAFKPEVWLTVPIRLSKGSKRQYNKVEIDYGQPWQDRHASLLRDAYKRAPFFTQYFDELMALLEVDYAHLAALNIALIRCLKRLLGIQTALKVASEFGQNLGTKSARLVGICQLVGGDTYLSGQGARAYNDETLFNSHDIQLVYQQFACPAYPQLYGEFISNLSVLDLLFNCGPDSQAILERA